MKGTKYLKLMKKVKSLLKYILNPDTFHWKMENQKCVQQCVTVWSNGYIHEMKTKQTLHQQQTRLQKVPSPQLC